LSGAGKPQMIIADTIKGRGVRMMEGNLNWHVGNLVGLDYDAVVAELQRGLAPAAG
jgi:transketolase